MSGLERKQVLRIDCLDCRGNGYLAQAGSETSCDRCGGSGLLDKEVPFKFDTGGVWKKEEIAEQFGVTPEQVRDAGHDAPKLEATNE